MIKIDKTVKAEIEETIGKSIPDTQSKEFELFYEWLVREHPKLARKLEQSLEVTEPYPEEDARKQAQRREGIAHTIQRMFYKQVWGKSVLNRRALSLTIFFLIFGVMMASWSLTFFRRPSRIEVAEQPTQPVQAPVNQAEVVTTETAPSDETNLLIVPEVQTNNPSPTESQKSSPLIVPDIPDAAPPRALPRAVSPSPLQPAPLPQATETIEEASKPIPQTAVLAADEAAPMPEFSVKAFEPVELATVPIVLTASEAVVAKQHPVFAFSNGEEALSETPVIAGDNSPSDGEGSTGPVVASTGNELATGSVLAFGADDTPVQSSVEIELSRANVSESVKTGTPPASLESSETNAEQVAQPPLATNTDGGLLETDLFNGNASDLLKPGMLIPATLQKDIILIEGETRQVLADAVEDWCGEESCPSLRWLGTAALSESGRLDVIFEEAILEGEVIELSGIAYGADNAEGLPAHLADTTPTLLADLLRAGAGGVTDYVEAEATRETVTREGDATVTETSVPGLLEFILGRAAGTLQVPEGETSVIRLAAVEKGTRLEVLCTENN